MRVSHSMPLALLCLAALSAKIQAESPLRVGILGDSYSDEYQFYPPDRATARNWMEILTTTRGVNFGAFSSESRGEPRNQGYEFNWARSDATTDDLIATGQHTGLAGQVARGDIDVVWIFIGGNDFIGAMKSRDPLATVTTLLPRALANFRAALETIAAASQTVRIVLVTVPDVRNLPEFAGPIREGRISTSTADEFTSAIARFNAQIRALAARSERIALLDFDLAVQFANRLSQDSILAAGRILSRTRPGNEPDCFFLADSRHPGTLGQTLLAQMFIETVNVKFGARIPTLSAREALGLIPPGATLATSASPSASARSGSDSGGAASAGR